jgi:TRAP-type C4-dicarboxylate transport system permease small subunit
MPLGRTNGSRPRILMLARRALLNFEEIGAAVGIILVVGIVIYNVVNRYVFQQSGVWAPELAGIIFPWVVFLGASAAWKRDMHISIAVVAKCLGPRTRALVQICGDILLVVFLAYATYLATKLTISGHSRLSPVLRVQFSYVYASAALAFGLMLVRRSIALGRSLFGGALPPGR